MDKAAGAWLAGIDGAEYEFTDGVRVRASAGASFKLFSSPQKLSLRAGRLTDTYTVLLTSGQLEVSVKPHPKRPAAVIVSGPNKATVIAVSGVLDVVADDEGLTVANRKGETLVSAGATAFRPQEPGVIRTFPKDGGPGRVEQLPAAPDTLLGKRVWVAGPGGAYLDGVHWNPVPGAARYSVRIESVADGAVIERALTQEPKFERSSRPFAPGVYRLSVRAVDRRGIEASATASAELRVVGLELPEGAYVDERGAVRLGEQQQVRLTHAEGLSISGTGRSRLAPAENPFGLHQGARTLIVLQRRGSPETASLWLKPRGISADVWVGSKFAMWPRDPLAITIRLKQTDGQSVPSWVQVVPKVTLGIEPIEVDWHWEGDTLRGSVPPARSRGPWVVRVEVSDQFGNPLGYDSCEVIAEPTKKRRLSSPESRLAAAPSLPLNRGDTRR